MTTFSSRVLKRLRRHLRDVLLLPLALLIIIAEDVIWRGSRALLRGLNGLQTVDAARRVLARLSGWAALPLFLIPEAAARVGELWTAILLYREHVVSAVLVYVLVRLLSTLIAVFIWQSCAPALMRLPWFARVAGWISVARDWALARTAPLRIRTRWLLRRVTSGDGEAVMSKVRALRQWMRARWTRVRP